METLTEIETREKAYRERAREYEIYKDQAWSANERLKNLEVLLKVPPPDLAPLREIIRLAGSLPARIYITHGEGFIQGGEDFRHVVMRETQHAIDRIVAARKMYEDALPEARANAERLNAKVAEYEQS